MPRAACDLLFVYGTLMSAATGALGEDMRQRLAREATSLGPASAPGRLYDLGRYPGLSVPEGPSERVAGELLRLAAPVVTLAWLDDYEGLGRPPGPADEYERVIEQIRCAGGDIRDGWLYRLRRSPAGRSVIVDGRWRGAAAARPSGAVQKD